MLPFFTENFGNPAAITSAHGRRASTAVEDARIAVARFFGVLPPEIYFTAGATESNNIALNLVRPGEHVVTSLIEHKSIVVPAERADVTFLKPDAEGFVDPDQLRDALRPNTKLVSIAWANGEIGTIERIRELAAICRERGVLIHSDATQAVGKIPVDFSLLDLASLSAHKIYGPKGIGALFVRRGTRMHPLIVGGGQERNVRSGTVNVPGVIGLAAALQLRAEEMDAEGLRLAALRDGLRNQLLATIPDVSINGPELRLPGNLNVSFDRIDAESLILAMKRFSLSTGSACSAGERGPSRVLVACGVSEPRAMGSIRIGLGKSNTEEHTSLLAADLRRAVARLREITAA